MMYLGMNRDNGEAITDTEHIRQSVRDILITPEGSRIAHREYGSLLSTLIDKAQNDVVKLQVMAAVYTALSRWEPRIRLSNITLSSAFDESMVVELTGQRADGSPLAMYVNTGVSSGGN